MTPKVTPNVYPEAPFLPAGDRVKHPTHALTPILRKVNPSGS